MTKSEWISVEDRLPMNRVAVWLSMDGDVELGFYCKKEGWIGLENLRNIKVFDTDHWMEILKPQPPEVKG